MLVAEFIFAVHLRTDPVSLPPFLLLQAPFLSCSLHLFLQLLLQALVQKSHDMLLEEICLCVYSMASVDFVVYHSRFLPKFLSSIEGLREDQHRELLKSHKVVEVGVVNCVEVGCRGECGQLWRWVWPSCGGGCGQWPALFGVGRYRLCYIHTGAFARKGREGVYIRTAVLLSHTFLPPLSLFSLFPLPLSSPLSSLLSPPLISHVHIPDSSLSPFLFLPPFFLAGSSLIRPEFTSVCQ